jgi:hypothetical protein
MSRNSKSALLGLVPALALVATLAPVADAAGGAGPRSPILDSWGSSVCGFAMMLAAMDHSFRPSAERICARVADPADG